MPKGVHQAIAVACAEPRCPRTAKAPRDFWPFPIYRIQIAADKDGRTWGYRVARSPELATAVFFLCPDHKATYLRS